ncbi:hypothetical protein [uncultured Enterovirga sp.]|uniref:hypothetical protein n=1 Tax=uncultured Enterovirga sp. TaxID=2026352 RepID=UPI0035C991DE
MSCLCPRPLAPAEASGMIAELAALLEKAWRLDGRIRERAPAGLLGTVAPALNGAEIDFRSIERLRAMSADLRPPDGLTFTA